MNKLKAPIFWLLLAMPFSVWALPDDKVRLHVEYSLAHDSNYYRLANASQAQAQLGTTNMAATIRTLTLALDADLKFSRQNVLLRTNVNQTRFDRHELQEQTGGSFFSDWQWVVGNKLNGDLSYLWSRQLQSQADLTSTTQAGSQDQKNLNFSANYSVHPSWLLLAGAGNSRTEFSLPSQAILNRDENNRNWGVRFVSRAGNQIGVQFRRTDGRYFNRPAPNGYEQTEQSLQVDWISGGYSRVHAQWGKTRRTENQSVQQTPTWSISADWVHSDKTTLSAFLRREIVSSNSLASTSSIVKRVQGMNVAWQLTAKTSLNASLMAQEQDYADISRTDHIQTGSLGMNYLLTRGIVLGLVYETERRNSNVNTADYQYRKLTANLRSTF